MTEISLFDDQAELLNEIRHSWRSNNRTLVMASTGFGKTRLAAKIISGLISRGYRVCFCVPRITLVDQSAAEFVKLGITDITLIQANYPTDDNAKVFVASAQTLIKRKHDFDVFIMDEAHKGFEKIHERILSGEYPKCIGLTATPYPKWMGTIWENLVKGKPLQWLINNKRLAPYEIYAPTKPNLSNAGYSYKNGERDYKENDIAEIMGDAKVIGDVVAFWLEHGENRITIALCCNVKHANQLANEFDRAGVTSEVITASTPKEERAVIIQRTRAGHVKVLLSVDCLTEGADLPEASCLINARPTKSLTRWIQGFGRVLRYMEGKTALIFDHSGTTLDPELGDPVYIDIESLGTGEEPARVKRTYDKEKTEKKPTECKKCKFVKPAGVRRCPKCGTVPRAGEDVEVDLSRTLTKIKGEKKKHTPQEKQAFYSELLGYRAERHTATGKLMAIGWVSHKYKEKFGVWPKSLHQTVKTPTPETRSWIKAQNIRAAKRREKQSENNRPDNIA